MQALVPRTSGCSIFGTWVAVRRRCHFRLEYGGCTDGGVDATVISNPLHVLRDLDADHQLDLVKRHNRYVASQQEKYDFIYGFASTVIFGGDRFLREFERAVRRAGVELIRQLNLSAAESIGS